MRTNQCSGQFKRDYKREMSGARRSSLPRALAEAVGPLASDSQWPGVSPAAEFAVAPCLVDTGPFRLSSRCESRSTGGSCCLLPASHHYGSRWGKVSDRFSDSCSGHLPDGALA